MTRVPCRLVMVIDGMLRSVDLPRIFGHNLPVDAETCLGVIPEVAQRKFM